MASPFHLQEFDNASLPLFKKLAQLIKDLILKFKSFCFVLTLLEKF